ncbi:hypothetical protein [Halobaculum sp. MBLA0143]|uniref:hypothetical protein n=1 Tax=Halobaculum sp. MBLA0143 TaxID=3079933 RepID=UPI0035241868
MPISIDGLENGAEPPRPEPPRRIVASLASHADLAYTPAEVAGELGVDHETVVTALDEPTDRGLVRRTDDHWTVADEERVAAAADLHAATLRLDDADGGTDATA